MTRRASRPKGGQARAQPATAAVARTNQPSPAVDRRQLHSDTPWYRTLPLWMYIMLAIGFFFLPFPEAGAAH